MPEIHVSALFCDDVRHEVGGKITAVGIYSNVLGFSGSAVAAMPKFVCLLMLTFRHEGSTRQGQVRVMNGDTALLDVPIPMTPNRPSPVSRPGDMATLNIPMELIGLEIRDGMVLRIEFDCDDFRWKSLPLEIRAETSGNTPSPQQ